MKRTLLLLALALSLSAGAERFHVLLLEYAKTFRPLARDVSVMAESVRARYPRTFFRVKNDRNDDDSVVEVLGPSEIKDTVLGADHVWARAAGYDAQDTFVEYDYTRLYRALDIAGGIIDAAVPERDVALKEVRVQDSFLDSARFCDALYDFNYFARSMGDIAGWAWGQAGFRLPDTELSVHRYHEIPDYHEWFKVQLALESLRIENTLSDFEARYGPQSDRINLLELLLINTLLSGDRNGPSPWEPILRISPVCYDVTSNRFIKSAQIGMSFYFLHDSPAWLRTLNHCGAAFLLADPVNDKVYWLDPKKLSPGVMAHVGKYEAGFLYDRNLHEWKVIGTVNFQIIPTIF
jgi:hypothetical protein